MEQQPQQVQIKASDEKVKGEYANMMQVIHTQEEFVLDFLNVFPPAGTLNSRNYRLAGSHEAHRGSPR